LNIFLLGSLASQAQENLNYQQPPASILQLVDYERAPSVQINNSKTHVLYLYRNTYKSLDDLNQEEVRLGGLRINPKHLISSTVTYVNNLKIKGINSNNMQQISGLPNNPKLSNISWSPDETKIVFTHTTETGLELWVL